jgi:Tol biopolymer transport system component
LTTGLDAFSLSISRDGTRLAYSALVSSSNVWAIDIPRSGPVSSRVARPITRGNQTIESADVSPDGQWLAFDSDRGGNYDIWRMPIAGGEPIQVTADPSSDFSPAWAPDGRRLSFHSMRNGNRDVFTINADGTEETQRTRGPREDVDTRWSADGTSLVFETVTQDRDVLHVLSLVDGSEHDLWQGQYARWSPADDEIAAIAPDGLRVGPASGGPTRLLVPSVGLDAGPTLCTWAPDARTIYYLFRDGPDWSIRSVPAVGGPSRLLVTFDDPGLQPTRYALKTDGQGLYFTVGLRESDVWVADLR